MDPAGELALVDAIAHMHGCKAVWLESVPVTEVFKGETIWSGEVQTFAVEHPKTDRCYAWSHAVDGSERRRFYAVLKLGPVVDAVTAVRAAIAARTIAAP
jgi:hypothetical protein